MNKKTSRILSVSLAAALTATLVVPALADNLVRKNLEVDSGLGLYVDGKAVTPTDAAGKTVDIFAADGTTYLPVRAMSNALGAQVGYDAENYRVYVDTAPVDEKAADYLKEYFGIEPMTGTVSAAVFNDALVKVFGEDAVKMNGDRLSAAVQAAVENCGLKELAAVYSAEKMQASTAGIAKVPADDDEWRCVAAALDTSLAPGTWDFTALLDGETATQLLMNAVNIAGKGRNYLGNASDPDIYQKLQSAWATFGNFDDEKLSKLGADLVIAGASTGYNLKYDGYNANFLPEYTFQYGHSDITHAIQLIALLNSEGIDAKVAMEPKTSIYEYLTEWGTPSDPTPTYEVKAIEGGRYLCYATEYDMKLEFDTVADKEAFDGLIGKYAKKWDSNTDGDGNPTEPLLAGAWWQPLYTSTVPMKDTENYTLIKDNVVHNGPYTIHPFSTVDNTDAIAKVVKEEAPDLSVELVDLYVNKAFYNYLTDTDHQ